MNLFTHVVAAELLSVLAVLSVYQERSAGMSDAPSENSALTYPISRTPVNRETYVNFAVREINPQSLIDNPDRGQYGPRHALSALALYSLTTDQRYGEAIKASLKAYDKWLKEEIGEQGAHFSWEGPYLCGLHVRELRKGGLLDASDEEWLREMFIRLADNLSCWAPGDGLWRGSQHRSQGQAIARGLAAMWYPDSPNAKEWQDYFKVVWNDWWQYRDVGINDTGYFFGSLQRILCAAELMGKKEVFTDSEVKSHIWDRLLYEVTPDGAVSPYGAHGGWNSAAGDRIFALELVASRTGDGRYRWVAHRLMNYLMARGVNLHNQHHLHALNVEPIALASIICDDNIEPVEPDPGSRVLYRKEVVRLTPEEAHQKYPGYGGLDCWMDMSQRVMPHKIVLRSGWQPGDFYMLVEAFPRHDPLNPAAIVGLTHNGSAMAMMESEKFISRENAVRIEDVSGEATYLGNPEHQGEKQLPTGYDGMEVEVKEFSDHKLASHAVVHVTNYLGYEAEHEREVLFIKNRFAVVRDVTTFNDTFKCRIGPVWNTQNVDPHAGGNWLNTYFSAFCFQGNLIYENPRWDVFVYHFPKPACQLRIEPREDAENASLSTQYAWEGVVRPGFKIQFSHFLLPHAPDLSSARLAANTDVVRDELNLSVLRVRRDEGGSEWVILNPEGREVAASPEAKIDGSDLSTLATDARAMYLDARTGKVARVLVIDATFLSANGNDLFRGRERGSFEKG